MRKIISYIMVASAFISFFTACGESKNTIINKYKKTESMESSISASGEWTGTGGCYSVENINNDSSVMDVLVVNEDIYTVITFGQGQYALEKNGNPFCVFQGSIYGLDATNDGEIWVFQVIYENGEIKNTIDCVSNTGEIVKSINLESEYKEAQFHNELKCTNEFLYLFRDDEHSLVIINIETGKIDSIPLISKNCSIVKGNDGQLYVVENKANENNIFLITSEETLSYKFKTENGKLLDGCDNSFFLLTRDDGLFSISPNGKSTPIILWSECGLNLGDIYKVFACGNKEYICDSIFGIKKLVPTDPTNIKIKKELIIATIGQAYNLQLKIANFNNSNEEYYIRIIDYSNGGKYNNSQALTRINTAIISGEIPDMICFDNISPYPFINKKMLVDLNELFINDSEISCENISIAHALDLSGNIYYISDGFAIETLVARYSNYGERYGWTLDEYIDADRKCLEGSQTLYNTTKKRFLENISSRYISQAVDWSNSTCNFNNKDFIKILDASKNIKETPEDKSNMVYGYGPAMVNGGTLIAAASWVTDVWKLAFEEKMAGCKLSYIGWPTVNGECGSDIYLDEPIGIVNEGKNIAGCWEFIKYILKNYSKNDETLPVFSPLLQKEIEYAKENKELPVQITDNDADRFLELLASINNVALYDDTIKNIIMANSEAFFNGSYTAEETASFIQSKATLYLSEQN